MLLGCAHAAPAQANGVHLVELALDDFHAAAAAADEERYFSHFTPDAVFLGTDATERWSVPAFRAYAHPHFAKGKAWTFRGVRRQITVCGDVAWFEEDLETQNLGPARGSGVLLRAANGWRIAQYVLSVTIPNDRFKDVRALLEGTTSPCRASP
jgi:ketosteroid isomerase-like protein